MSDEPFVLGAAMPSTFLDQYGVWLIEKQRDLELQDIIGIEVLDGNYKQHAKDIKARLDGFEGRLGIHGPFLGLNLAAPDPKIQQVTADRLKQGVEFAEIIGATHMVVHSPIMSLGNHRTHPSFQIEMTHVTLKDVVPMAEAAGCNLVIENIFDKHTDIHLELIKSFESNFVRASIDTGHAFITHVEGGPPVDHWIRAMGAKLEHVHLQDTDGYTDRHWVPGDGHIGWRAVFAELAKLEQCPRLILELWGVNEIPRAMAWFESEGIAQ